MFTPMAAMRLDKFICKSTALSRAEAQAAIHAGTIRVNAEVVTDVALQVHENNNITLAGQALWARPSRYIMVHKPGNTICSNVDEAYPSLLNTIDLDDCADLHITGRLDADTTGLVLVTDDGRWSFNIIRPQQQCDKVYRVHVRHPIAANVVDQFAHGLQLQGEEVGNRVVGLHRQSIGSLSLDVDVGQWRHLTAEEVASFE